MQSDENYTNPRDYDIILDWITDKAGIDKSKVIRPFYPGGDYKSVDYTNKIVVDNPPFSMEQEIVEFYNKNKIPFFLFIHGKTMIRKYTKLNCLVFSATQLTYSGQGKTVLTGFVTNMLPYNVILAGDLFYRLKGHYLTHKKYNGLPTGFVGSAQVGKYIKPYDLAGKCDGELTYSWDYYGGAIDFSDFKWRKI